MTLTPPAHGEDVAAALAVDGFSDITHVAGRSITLLFEATKSGTRYLVTTRGNEPRDLSALRRRLEYRAPGVLRWGGLESLDARLVLLVEERGHGAPVLERGPLGADELAFVIGSMGRALAALHATGHVVGGLDPDLVFVTGEPGQARLAGFTGRQAAFTADAFESVLDGTPLLVGGYAPLDAQPTAASDVFALAGCAVKLVTGHHPYSDEPHGLLRALVRGDRQGPKLEGKFGALVDAALARRPEDRPSLSELLDGLAVQTSGAVTER